MSDLVARLRALAEENFEMLDDIHIPLNEAADAIESLRRNTRASGTLRGRRNAMTNHPNRSRQITFTLSRAEYEQIMWCVGNFTDANARDWSEMRQCGVTNPGKLIGGELKMISAANGKSDALTAAERNALREAVGFITAGELNETTSTRLETFESAIAKIG